MDDKKLLNGKFTFKSCVSENVNRQLAESKEVVGLPFIGNLTVTVQCFLNKRPDCYVLSKLEKKKILSHGLTALLFVLVYLKCALYNFILYRPVWQCWFSIKSNICIKPARSEERRLA